MKFSRFIYAIIMILMLSSSSKKSMANPRTETAAFLCNTSTALSSSIYGDNFIPAMTNLSSLVNQKGFGTTIVGEGASALFALAQCYKDLNSSDCSLCFAKIRSVLPTCYHTIGGRLFLDGCFGRYENFTFFDQGLDSVKINNCSDTISSSDKFGGEVKKVVENVRLKAKKSNGFAVDHISGSEFNVSVYALAQCWESLDGKICSSCLEDAAASIVSCAPSVEGRSMNAGCYMRYSTELFWNSEQDTDSSSDNQNSVWIILGSVIGACLLLTVISLWKAKKWLRRQYHKLLKDSHGSGLWPAITQSKLFKYQELRKATNNFDSSNVLGQGTYGTVYKGILADRREVAVKRLFLNTRSWIDQFANEVDLVNQVRHKNLVKLLGCSVDGPESLLVFEYCLNKSLDHFLFDKSMGNALDWKKRLDIIQGVAEGLSYLHRESEIRIIHRDIKASNILINDKFIPKITDFGLARSFTEDQTHLSTKIAGTLGYMAPEYVIHGHLTEKADVYSFGVLTLEILTSQRCSNGLGAKPGQHLLAEIWSHYKAKTIETIIDKSFYEEALKGEILHVANVALLCTQAAPSYRPTMPKVVELLRSKTDQENAVPTDPPFLNFVADEEGEYLHVVSLDSAPGSSGSLGSLYGR